jgi:hypothetical protein
VFAFTFQAKPERQISRRDYLAQVDGVLLRDRGRELPGLFNPMIVTQLFRRQCRPWRDISERACGHILDVAFDVTQSMVQHAAVPETADVLAAAVGERFAALKAAVAEKLVELLDQHLHGHPITCDQGLLDTVHAAHLKRHRRSIRSLLLAYDPKKGIARGVDHFVNGFKKDLGSYGSSIALDYMQAYYKVREKPSGVAWCGPSRRTAFRGPNTDAREISQIAMENFIDSFSTLAIERCLVARLPTLFSPTPVAGFSDDETRRMSAETAATAAERRRCEAKLRVLEKGMDDLRRLQRREDVK